MQLNGKQITDNSINLNGSNGSIGNKINISGDWNIGVHSIETNKSIADITSNKEYITKEYADAILNGLTIKKPVRVATTQNINLSSPPSIIDSINLVLNDRILVKDQTSGQYNGIYIYNTSGLVRSSDFDEDTPIDEVISGAYVNVLDGIVNKYSKYVLVTPNPILVNSTSQDWGLFNSGTLEVTELYNTVFVDPNGSDTAISGRGQIIMPYQTIQAAINATTSGTIIVLDGVYTVNENIAKSDITLHFYPNATINANTEALFDVDIVTGFKITGNGKFINSSGTVYRNIYSTNPNFIQASYIEGNPCSLELNSITYLDVDVLKSKVTITEGSVTINNLVDNKNFELIEIIGGIVKITGEFYNEGTTGIIYSGGNIILNGATMNKLNSEYIYATTSGMTLDVYAGGVTVLNGNNDLLLGNPIYPITNRTGGQILYV